jgi:non-ribosomal peptide synthetase component F
VPHTSSDRTREVCLGAFAHQYVPFERLVEELEGERNPGETPLVQAMCVLQNTPVAEAELPGLSLAPIPLESTTAKFDPTLSLVPGDGLHGGIEYRSGLFAAEMIQSWAEALEILCQAAIADPEQCLSRLSMRRDDP